jgi:alpha-ketoglutarate-dependent taurine dioxygenase
VEVQIPLLIERPGLDMVSWLRQHRPVLDDYLRHTGAVLLRGFELKGKFGDVISAFSAATLEYVYRSTPRVQVAPGIYTATEYPAGLNIPMHNENSYQREWPLHLLFLCEIPATVGGGQTPLASSTNVTRRIRPDIRDRFRKKKLMYIRNYRHNVDLPWQSVFQTESKEQVEKYCRDHDISFTWHASDTLRTEQVCEAFAHHPITNEELWFNQAHLFHPSALDNRTRKLMVDMFDEDEFPRMVRYGDGTAIVESDLEEVREAYRHEIVEFEWRGGDLLLLDNMLVAHGRSAFKGSRRILVAMCDPCSSLKHEEDRGNATTVVHM